MKTREKKTDKGGKKTDTLPQKTDTFENFYFIKGGREGLTQQI